MKKVSILIPLYNAENYIAATLESALDQSWSNTEIIVVDDGSTDEGVAIVERYKDQGVLLFSQKNQGASAARNTAFDRSTGDYIQYLDADDLLSPNKIKEQVVLLDHADSRAVSSSSWGRFYNNPAHLTIQPEEVWKDYDQPIDWLIDSWEGGGMMQTSCWLTPRELIQECGGWNENIKMNDDGEFFARVLLTSTGIAFCKQATVCYRSGLEESKSQSLNPMAIQSLYDSYLSYERCLLSMEDSPRVRHALMKNYLNFIYRFHPEHTRLIDLCRQRINALGFNKLEPTGGKKARMLTKWIGFNNMLRLRAAFK